MKNKIKAALWFSPVATLFLVIPTYLHGVYGVVYFLGILLGSSFLTYCLDKCKEHLE